MSLTDATEAETEEMAMHAQSVLRFLQRGRHHLNASTAIEVLALALRLLYDAAPPRFKEEMLEYLVANLAEMRGVDA